MTRPAWLFAVVVLVMGSAMAATSCGPRTGTSKPSSPVGQGKSGSKAPPPPRHLPPALALPREPPAAAHVAAPAALLATLDPYVPESLHPTLFLRRELGRVTTPAMASALASAVDPYKAWSAARLGPQNEIAYFPVRTKAASDLRFRLAKLPPKGKFGAVTLPAAAAGKGRPARPRYIAWYDERSGTLTIARTLRGTVTGPKLRTTYGHKTVTLRLAGNQIPRGIPLSNVTATGSLGDFSIRAKFRAGQDPIAQNELRAGALTGLLDDPGIIAGGSTRWSGSDNFIKKTISRTRKEVGRQSFLVRGVLEDMAAKFYTALRSWDGRALIALGRPKHLRLAFGSTDPAKSERAVLRLLAQVKANAEILRNFTSGVPKVSLRKNAATAGKRKVHRVTLSGIRKYVPAELKPLLDAKGRLKLALAWSPRAQAGLVVVGPQATDELKRWLRATSRATPGAQTRKDVLAGTLSVAPAQLAQLSSAAPSWARLWSLRGGGPRSDLVARRSGKDGATLRVITKAATRSRKHRGQVATTRASPRVDMRHGQPNRPIDPSTHRPINAATR
ncbi:MAG: hypothetical protein V3V08_00770 [Nannocystaceae bacterium]